MKSKRITGVLAALIVLASAALAQTTPNLGLNIPSQGTAGWDVLLNQNFTALDGLLGGTSGVSQLTVGSFNKVIYVDGIKYLTVQAALLAANAAGGGVVVVPPGTYAISGTTTLSATITLRCENRSTLQYATNSAQLVFNGQGSKVDGCGFVGQGAGTSGLPPVVSSGYFFEFTNNSISLFGPTSGAGTLNINRGQNVLVSGNIFNVNGDFDVLITNATPSQIMYGITVANNIGSDIAVSNTGASASLAAVNIANNQLAAGEASKTNPCVKVSSTGTNVADLVVAGNNCVLSQVGPTVAYSINNTTSGQITGNVYDASGFSGTVDGMLLNSVNNVNVSDNVIWNSAAGIGIALTGTNTSPTVRSNNIDNTVTGISLGGTTSGALVGANNIITATTGITVGASSTNASIEPQKFTSVTTTYSDSGSGTDIRNRSYFGTVTLSSGTGTFTIPAGGAFQSTSTFACNTNDTTTIANASKAAPASTTTATVTGTGTDVIAVTCAGH
jgi:hypothetical protein